jgi:hypothetical protein
VESKWRRERFLEIGEAAERRETRAESREQRAERARHHDRSKRPRPSGMEHKLAQSTSIHGDRNQETPKFGYVYGAMLLHNDDNARQWNFFSDFRLRGFGWNVSSKTTDLDLGRPSMVIQDLRDMRNRTDTLNAKPARSHRYHLVILSVQH